LAVLGTKHKDDFEPYWQDEKDWLCIVELLATDDPEGRLYSVLFLGIGHQHQGEVRHHCAEGW
jgi:hypothetical protein